MKRATFLGSTISTNSRTLARRYSRRTHNVFFQLIHLCGSFSLFPLLSYPDKAQNESYEEKSSYICFEVIKKFGIFYQRGETDKYTAQVETRQSNNIEIPLDMCLIASFLRPKC